MGVRSLSGRELNNREIHEYVTWLESEIDLCLACDLPVEYLEKDLIAALNIRDRVTECQSDKEIIEYSI
ncbi:hypothetical protein LLG96_03745 [bacterium]|nr:hypothetical protein [bacterium]